MTSSNGSSYANKLNENINKAHSSLFITIKLNITWWQNVVFEIKSQPPNNNNDSHHVNYRLLTSAATTLWHFDTISDLNTHANTHKIVSLWTRRSFIYKLQSNNCCWWRAAVLTMSFWELIGREMKRCYFVI